MTEPIQKPGPQENSAGTPQPRANKAAAEPAKNGEDGRTKVEQDGDTAPRLPHERDQSSDSQKNPGGEATEMGKKAFEDAASGAVDTDRAPVTDKVYNEQVKR
ncbi:MAG: hypothetical protein ACRYGA_07580 [Janthinobacterium lividum]